MNRKMTIIALTAGIMLVGCSTKNESNEQITETVSDVVTTQTTVQNEGMDNIQTTVKSQEKITENNLPMNTNQPDDSDNKIAETGTSTEKEQITESVTTSETTEVVPHTQMITESETSKITETPSPVTVEETTYRPEIGDNKLPQNIPVELPFIPVEN